MPGIDVYTVLMLHMDGTDEATTFTDSSSSGHTITASGQTNIEKDQAVFAQSGQFDGTDDYLSIPDSADWNFGTGDFTIDFWVYAINSTGQVIGQSLDGSTNWYIRFNSGIVEFGYILATINKALYKTVDNISTSTWTHLEVSRSGADILIFINGQKQILDITTAISTTSMPDLSDPLIIGCRVYSTTKDRDYNGYIDELRVSKGICRHTDTFIPLQVPYDNTPDFDSIQVSNITLDVEIDSDNLQVANLSLEAEISTGDLQVANLSLEVEIEIPTELNISQHIPKIEILQYIQSGEIASVPDISTMVLVNNHNLNPGDFFVNKTVRDLYTEYGTERGSRRVLITPDTDEIGYNVDIADAQAGDEIWLFSFVDVTQYLMRSTLSITKKANNSNTANFRFKLPIASDLLSFYPHPGQYVRIGLDNELYFMGLISDVDLVGVNDGVDVAFQNINCIGLKAIPARRTVSINYSQAKLAGDIVQELVDGILVQEGFLAFDSTYISDGLYLGKPWSNDCITISDILDELATRNGFQWFVDDDIRMHFYQDPATFEDAPYNLEQNGILKFRDLSISHSIENYINKVFVIGGKDINGDQIKTSNINLLQQNNIQFKCGGSGIYGGIIRDSAIATALYRPAEAGTAFFTIKITGHNMSVGDYLYNETLGRAFWVASVIDVDTFTVNETIYDQAEGDSIATFPSADHAGLTMLRNQSFMPKTVEYTIDHIFMKPQTKQIIDLPRYGVSGETYNIESVTIKERGSGLFESRITATLKNPSDFTTQPHPTYIQYYRGL
jgi:hypothetical protein